MSEGNLVMSQSHSLLRFAPLALGAVVFAAGCFSASKDCWRTLTCGPDSGGGGGAGGAGGAPDAGMRCIADPSTASAIDDCGIFVSSSRGDDKNPGTRDAPVRTIGLALKLAAEAEQRVYACAELFSEAVVMPSGFTLFGGLDCQNGWAYSGASTRTMIKPLESAIALTFLKGEHGLSLVTDVHAEGPNASAPGASSIAVLAREGSEVELRRCALVANHGAAGWPGEPGDEHNMPGGAGTPGKPGADACSADMVSGGAQVKTSCGGLTSIGAQGEMGGLLPARPARTGSRRLLRTPWVSESEVRERAAARAVWGERLERMVRTGKTHSARTGRRIFPTAAIGPTQRRTERMDSPGKAAAAAAVEELERSSAAWAPRAARPAARAVAVARVGKAAKPADRASPW